MENGKWQIYKCENVKMPTEKTANGKSKMDNEIFGNKVEVGSSLSQATIATIINVLT